MSQEEFPNPDISLAHNPFDCYTCCMDKKPIYFGIGLLVIGVSAFSFFIVKNNSTSIFGKKCTTEARLCPDGSYVSRSGKECAFELCKTDTQVATTSTIIGDLATSTQIGTTTKTIEISSDTIPKIDTISKKINTPSFSTQTTKRESPSFFSSIVSSLSSSVSSLTNTISSSFKKEQPTVTNNSNISNSNDAAIPASSYITSSSTNNSAYQPLPPTDFAGQKYLVEGNNILSNDNKVIYTIPPEVVSAVSSSNSGWTNTTINVVPVGVVPPILNAIPISNLPGKYYLSENSFGDMNACEFSNKIFILDTNTNTVELMYEENNTTLSRDDPRACNSEIFLLATEGQKLVLKYHTIGTNTLCDSAWSEPEKTFYLDVTQLQRVGMRKYDIPFDLTTNAESEEEACREKL